MFLALSMFGLSIPGFCRNMSVQHGGQCGRGRAASEDMIKTHRSLFSGDETLKKTYLWILNSITAICFQTILLNPAHFEHKWCCCLNLPDRRKSCQRRSGSRRHADFMSCRWSHVSSSSKIQITGFLSRNVTALNFSAMTCKWNCIPHLHQKAEGEEVMC